MTIKSQPNNFFRSFFEYSALSMHPFLQQNPMITTACFNESPAFGINPRKLHLSNIYIPVAMSSLEIDSKPGFRFIDLAKEASTAINTGKPTTYPDSLSRNVHGYVLPLGHLSSFESAFLKEIVDILHVFKQNEQI